MGQGGDGRWPLEWKQISCPARKTGFKTEGSHQFFAKVKATGGPAGVESMVCNGMQGRRTPDGFFEFQDNSGQLCKGMTCAMRYTNGASKQEKVSGGVICG